MFHIQNMWWPHHVYRTQPAPSEPRYVTQEIIVVELDRHDGADGGREHQPEGPGGHVFENELAIEQLAGSRGKRRGCAPAPKHRVRCGAHGSALVRPEYNRVPHHPYEHGRIHDREPHRNDAVLFLDAGRLVARDRFGMMIFVAHGFPPVVPAAVPAVTLAYPGLKL